MHRACHMGRLVGAGVGGRDALEGQGSPPSLQCARPMPSHCPPDGKRRSHWHVTDSNRPQPFRQPPQPPA